MGMGHSMGGILTMNWASTPSARREERVKALVTFHGPLSLRYLTGGHCGAETITKPVLVIAGSADWMPGCFACNMLETYKKCQSREKVYMEVEGAEHPQVMDGYV